MILETIKLWFHPTIYTRKNKHKGWYTIKEGSSRHYVWQQRCQIA